MASCDFLLEITVSQFESSLVRVEDFKDLRIEVTFNKKVIAIKLSHFDMTEFQGGSSTNFSGTAKQLRQKLEKCGLHIAVNYSDSILGTAQITFPSNILDAISDEGMEDVIHMEMCQIARQGLIVGTMKVFARLALKNERMATLDDCLHSMDRSLCPKDILFLMAECQRIPNHCSPSHPCLDGDLLDDDLDIRRNSSNDVMAAKLKQIFTYDPVTGPILCQIKGIGTDYERAIDCISGATGRLKPPCRRAEALPTDDPCSSPSTPAPRRRSQREAGPPARMPNELTACRCTQPFMRPRRFCPVCRLNLTWLPKFANCPRCGVKPMPTGEQRRPIKKEDDLLLPSYTSADVCQQLPAGSEKKMVTRCRCKCLYGKLCAYCRVRKQNPDVIPPPTNHTSSSEEDDKLSDICVSKKSSEFRPFLSQMFSELCILHNVKVTKPENCATVSPKSQPAEGVVEGNILPKDKSLKPPSPKQTRKQTGKN